MAVLGIGQDLVEVDRITQSIQQYGERFLLKIFTQAEIAICSTKAVPNESFAVRFAAKEAVAKAFGVGIGQHIGWQDIEIQTVSNGAPQIKMSEKFTAILPQLRSIHLSLSHTHRYATAIALLES
jgi:holo-[acyl-carrier protein] synthase